MKIAITMRTSDRSPGPNYLRQTIDNLGRAGVYASRHLSSFDVVTSHSPTLALERELESLPELVRVTRSTRTLTPNECATEAHTVADSHDADYVLFIEDDVDFCADFLESVAVWLEKYVERQYPLYAFGSAAVSTVRSGAKPIRVNGFYGTQCYAVSRYHHANLVQWLIDNPFYQGKPRCHDLRLHHWATELRATHFLASCPSFVQHIGDVSGMGCPKVIFKSWPGREWSYIKEIAA